MDDSRSTSTFLLFTQLTGCPAGRGYFAVKTGLCNLYSAWAELECLVVEGDGRPLVDLAQWSWYFLRGPILGFVVRYFGG